jgi:hypothetical protein
LEGSEAVALSQLHVIMDWFSGVVKGREVREGENGLGFLSQSFEDLLEQNTFF